MQIRINRVPWYDNLVNTAECISLFTGLNGVTYIERAQKLTFMGLMRAFMIFHGFIEGLLWVLRVFL